MDKLSAHLINIALTRQVSALNPALRIPVSVSINPARHPLCYLTYNMEVTQPGQIVQTHYEKHSSNNTFSNPTNHFTI